jgi:hypothetical protein
MNALRTGKFGGWGGYVRPFDGGTEWHILTSYEGVPADALKAYVFCLGFRVRTIDIPNLSVQQTRHFELQLQPLGTLPFVGRVLGSITEDYRAIEVSAHFSPSWSCDFFGLPDCLTSEWLLGTTELRKDNIFEIDVPDFLADPVISSTTYPGGLSFRLRDGKTGTTYRLEPTASTRPVPLASAYGEHLFVVRLRK